MYRKRRSRSRSRRRRRRSMRMRRRRIMRRGTSVNDGGGFLRDKLFVSLTLYGIVLYDTVLYVQYVLYCMYSTICTV